MCKKVNGLIGIKHIYQGLKWHHIGKTNKSTAWQKKPEINKMLFKLLVSGVSLRRASQILDVEYNTIVKHFGYLAKQCQELHKEHLKTIKTSFVMVDEMETFLHARPKAYLIPYFQSCIVFQYLTYIKQLNPNQLVCFLMVILFLYL